MKGLTERAQKLSNFLWSRKRAVETSQLREKAQLLERKFLDEGRDNHKGGLYMMKIMIMADNNVDRLIKPGNTYFFQMLVTVN